MSETAPLSPAEAVVLRNPNLPAGLLAIKVTLLLLLTKGVLKLEQVETPGFFGPKKVPHLRIAADPKDAPPEARALLDVVRAAQADGGKIADVIKRASKDWGNGCPLFVDKLVRPSLFARGLLTEKKVLFARTFHATDAGKAERDRIAADLAKARDIPSLLTSDPARAAAIAAAVGTTLLLDDKLTKQFKPLADAMRAQGLAEAANLNDFSNTGSFDFGSFDLSHFDAGALSGLDAGMASFDAGFSGGGSDSN